MLPEALVIFACINNAGCTETSNQYFVYRPDVKQYIDHTGERARQFIGPKIVDTFGPMLFVVAGGRGTIRLSQYWSLQFSKQDGIISFRMDF